MTEVWDGKEKNRKLSFLQLASLQGMLGDEGENGILLPKCNIKITEMNEILMHATMWMNLKH